MIDEIGLAQVEQGSPEQEQIVEITELFRKVLTDAGIVWTDPFYAPLVMTAASSFAGMVFGTLIVMGVADDKDKRRITESMAHNFREGIKVGKTRAARIEQESGMTGRA